MQIRTIEQAREWRAKQELNIAALPDKEASRFPELHQKMKYNGEEISAGTRIKWDNEIKRAAVTLWDTVENNPDNSPTLWETLEYVNGVRKIIENMTAGMAFSLNEEGWWQGKIYISQMYGNVFTPVTAPEQWKLKEE